jgi:C-terminal processing protease CtpA/Prc
VDERESGPFQLELARRGTVEVSGIPPRQHGAARTRPAPRPVVALEILEQPGLGLLSVSTFGDPGGGEPSFPELLARSFAQLREAKVENLVLDLRGNGGGEDMYGALLVSYLSAESFGYFDRIEVTEDYAQFGETLRRDGRRLMLSHDGLQVQEPAQDRFTGKVYLLIDGWTFSTAADVATVAHHNGLATFVGEETGGGYDGNTSGVSGDIALVHSGFGVRVPRWMYTTANVGHAYPGRGVPPDHHVPGTAEEALTGRDPQLELVRQLLRE